MHPATTLQLLPMPQALAKAGVHVLCAGSRFAKNDTPLIMEKVALDLGAYVRHAKEKWGYEKILLCGWSGGGSLSLFYQSQAEKPSITHTPAGDEVDLKEAGLIPADAMHLPGRAPVAARTCFSEWIDPSRDRRGRPRPARPRARHLQPEVPQPAAVFAPISSGASVPRSWRGCGAGPPG